MAVSGKVVGVYQGGGGCLPRWGCLPKMRVCMSRGVSAQGGPIGRPPAVARMTDACENIIFLQLLLRTVKKV